MKAIDEKKVFLKFQKDEATAVLIYGKLSRIIKDENNSKILARIASEEAGHYETFGARTGVEVKPRRVFALAVVLLARILGITFALKLLEKGEEAAQAGFQSVIDNYPELKQTMDEEEKHEKELLEMIEEESLEYVGSMVLGLNDALVELTGALAGLTLGLKLSRHSTGTI